MSDAREQSATHQLALAIGSALLDQVSPDYRAASQHLSVAEGTTVADVLLRIGLPPENSLLIVLNDTLVTRPQLGVTTLSNGDELSLMAPIHAG